MASRHEDSKFDAKITQLVEFDTATIWEVSQQGALEPGLRPVTVETRVGGPALTVFCPAGDNLAIHLAVAGAKAGEVLVVQTNDPSYGVWGEVLTVAAIARGIKGLVLDGSARDVDSIRERGFPVFARGTALVGAAKAQPGGVRVQITCAGQIVEPGDAVVADASGVVVVRRDRIDEVIELAKARQAKEANLFKELERGRTTVELLGLGRPTGAGGGG